MEALTGLHLVGSHEQLSDERRLSSRKAVRGVKVECRRTAGQVPRKAVLVQNKSLWECGRKEKAAQYDIANVSEGIIAGRRSAEACSCVELAKLDRQLDHNAAITSTAWLPFKDYGNT